MRAALLLVPLLLAGADDDGPAFVVPGRVAGTGPGARVRVFDRLLPSVLLGEARSGEGGAFAVPIGREAVAGRPHPWAPVLVRIEAADRARRAVVWAPGGDPLAVRLVAPVVRRGTLVDGAGRPVPGAFLAASQPPGVDEVLVTTDERGAFEIPGLGPEPVRLRIRAPGFAPREIPWESGEAIVLEPAAPGEIAERVALEGRVLDADGGAVPGARVTAGGVGAWTDATGAWRLELPATGMTTLSIEAPGKAPRRIALRTDRAGRIDLRVVDGTTIHGRLVDADGAPVLGAFVGAFPAVDGAAARPAPDARALGRRLAPAWSGPDGRFTLRGVPPDARRLVARGHGLGSVPRPLPAGDTPVLVLQAELSVTVTVRDDAARPVAGAQVALRPWSGGAEAAAGTTDADGRFVAPVPAGRLYEVSVHSHDLQGVVEPGGGLELVAALDHGDAAIRYALPGLAADIPVEVSLRHAAFARRSTAAPGVFADLAPGRYEVTARAEGFFPETRTVVLAEPDAERSIRFALRRAGEVTLRASPGARVAVQTLAGEPSPVVVLALDDGTQVVQGFGPGRYRFLARAPGELIRVVEAELGPDAPPVDLDLHGGAASTLTVEVVDRAGAPVEGARLALRTPGGFSWDTGRRTDAAGRARLERLIAGPVEVRASLGDRLGAARVTVTPDAELRAVVTLP